MSVGSFAERRGLPRRPTSAGASLRVRVEDEGGRWPARARPELRRETQADLRAEVRSLVGEGLRAEVRSLVATSIVQEVAAAIQESLATTSESLVVRFRQELQEEAARTREVLAQVGQAVICQSRDQLVELNVSVRRSLEDCIKDCSVCVDPTQLAEAITNSQQQEDMNAVKAKLSKLDHLDELSSRVGALAEGSEQLRAQMTAFCQQPWAPPAELDASIRRSIEDCKVQVDCSQLLEAISALMSAMASAWRPTPGGSGLAEPAEEKAARSSAQWENHSSVAAADGTSLLNCPPRDVGEMARELEVTLEQDYFALLLEIRKMSQSSATGEPWPALVDQWARFARFVRSAPVANSSGTSALRGGAA